MKDLAAIGNPPAARGPYAPPLVALYVISALAGSATGLFNPLASALLAERGASALTIGVTSSVFFLFVMLAAPLARWAMHEYGARVGIVAGLMLTAAAALHMQLATALPGWLAARAVMGVGIGLYMIGGQTALGALAREEQRGVTSALHALAFGIGLGLGPLAGTALYGVSPMLAFVSGAVPLLLGVPLALRLLPPLRLQAQAPRYALARGLAAPLHAVFAYGVAEATLLTLYPVFLLQRGQAVGDIGVAFAAFVVGGLASALPLSHLADRAGRERVLLGCALAGAAAATALVFAQGMLLTSALSLLAGASLGPVYAIALAIMGQRLARTDLAAGSALFTAAFSAGSLLAPWLAALIMQRFGSEHVFTLTALLFASLAVRLLRRAPARACARAEGQA